MPISAKWKNIPNPDDCCLCSTACFACHELQPHPTTDNDAPTSVDVLDQVLASQSLDYQQWILSTFSLTLVHTITTWGIGRIPLVSNIVTFRHTHSHTHVVHLHLSLPFPIAGYQPDPSSFISSKSTVCLVHDKWCTINQKMTLVATASRFCIVGCCSSHSAETNDSATDTDKPSRPAALQMDHMSSAGYGCMVQFYVHSSRIHGQMSFANVRTSRFGITSSCTKSTMTMLKHRQSCLFCQQSGQ